MRSAVRRCRILKGKSSHASEACLAAQTIVSKRHNVARAAPFDFEHGGPYSSDQLEIEHLRYGFDRTKLLG